MRCNVFILVTLATTLAAAGQETAKPQVGKVVGIPSDLTVSGNCTAATQGYLSMPKGRTKLTEAEIGKFVRSSLRNGYVITVYPETGNGIFVDLECLKAKQATASPSTP